MEIKIYDNAEEIGKEVGSEFVKPSMQSRVSYLDLPRERLRYRLTNIFASSIKRTCKS